MSSFYILEKDGTIRGTDDAHDTSRHVRLDKLPNGKVISTIFLGLDHQTISGGRPVLFETMVFDDDDNGTELDQHRYTTKDVAILGHEGMVKKWEGKS